MLRDQPKSTVPLLSFIVSFLTRLLAVPLSLLGRNPSATADVVGFAASAQAIASNLQSGVLSITTPRPRIYDIWGAVLSPFWLVPGPSFMFAHLFVALLGALAAYNVAVIAQWYHSSRAALFAALPFAFYPSFVLMHGTLLRESAVVFGITTAVRLLVAPPPRVGKRWSVLGATVALGGATLLRTDNLPIYLIAVSVGCVIYYRQHVTVRAATLTGVAAGIIGVPFLTPSVLAKFNELRSLRGYGRTAYLEHIRFSGVIDLVAFSWIGGLYFLFAPFPWMVGAVADAVTALEGVVSFGYAIAAIAGVRYSGARSPPATGALVSGFILGVVLYGFGTVNAGTAIRHRQMFLWVIFVFGGVALASKIRIKGGRS